MNELQIFNSSEFGQIRTITKDNEPMFCLGDLCKALELTAKGVKQRLDDEVISNYPIEDSLGRMQNTLFVNEDGLYDVILESRKDSAKKFRKWVTSEVLPTIRKTGTYSVPQTTAGQIQLLAKGHTELEQKVDSINADLQCFKKNLPLLPAEADSLKAEVNKRAINALGGKDSNAYRDRSLRSKVYSDIYNELKRQFGVTKYVYIKGNKLDDALCVVSDYELPLVLMEKISDSNSQMSF